MTLNAGGLGGVLSSLTVTEAEAESPALLAAVQEKTVPAVSVVSTVGLQPTDEPIPEPVSTTVQEMVTSELFQPAAFGEGVTTGEIRGGDLSIRTVTDAELVRPAPFVALQVKVVPAVSSVRPGFKQNEE
ncbi:MAG: hypothetical protein LAP85_25420 [Acidobacteriia bacterium]|nr:hypothetical protein [Terriglobia bacterium]